MNPNKLHAALFALAAAIILSTVAFSQGAWEVTLISPTPIGPQVAKGQHNSSKNPDVTWVATDNGLVQAIFEDIDPKCDEVTGYVQVEATVLPIPTAPGPCVDPVDDLLSTILLTVDDGDLVGGEVGDSSGRFVFNFATFTPSPTYTPSPPATHPNTPTATPTATATVEPTFEVATAIPTHTHTPVPVVEATPTPTNTVEPPALDVPVTATGPAPSGLPVVGQPQGEFTLSLPFVVGE